MDVDVPWGSGVGTTELGHNSPQAELLWSLWAAVERGLVMATG